MTHAVTFDMNSALPGASTDSHLFDASHAPLSIFGLLTGPGNNAALQVPNNNMDLDNTILQPDDDIEPEAELDNENELADTEEPAYDEGTISA